MCSSNLDCSPRSKLLQQPGGSPGVSDPLEDSVDRPIRHPQRRADLGDGEAVETRPDNGPLIRTGLPDSTSAHNTLKVPATALQFRRKPRGPRQGQGRRKTRCGRKAVVSWRSTERGSRLRTNQQTRQPTAETADNPKVFPLFVSLSSIRGCGKKIGEL
jgi:hypothetical protein